MKKNTMMRVASVLLVAVLLSTCAISGTFAKYVTSDRSTDRARVAKWGVTVVASGDDLFNNQYTDTTNGVTVKSKDDAKVVAPGTSNDEFDATGMTFTIKGTPEVAVRFTYNFTATEDIFLDVDTYADDTTGDSSDSYEVTEKYYPVVYTLTKDNVQVATGDLADIKTYFDGLSTDIVAANTKLDSVYVLTWAWDFSETNPDNQMDTTLGNIATGTTTKNFAGVDLVEGTDYNLDLEYSLEIIITQVN